MHRQLGGLGRKLAEVKSKGPGANPFDADNVFVRAFPSQRSFRFYRIERPDNIVDGDRLPVMPVGIVPQGIGDPAVIVCQFDTLCQVTIRREKLIAGPFHQCVVNQHAGNIDTGRRYPLVHIGMQVVERTDHCLTDLTAFGCIDVGVIEIGKIFGIFEVAKIGQTVAGLTSKSCGGN